MEVNHALKKTCDPRSLPDRRLGWTDEEWIQFSIEEKRRQEQVWKERGWWTAEDWAKNEWEECGTRARKAEKRMGSRPY